MWATEKQIWLLNKLISEKTEISKKDRDNYFLKINGVGYRMSKNHKSGLTAPTFEKAKIVIDALINNNFAVVEISSVRR